MTPYRRKALRMVEAARPASGYRPETEAEWQRLQAAQIEFACAMYRDIGKSEAEARAIAELIHGGAAGRLLLDISFSDDAHE